MPYAMAFIFIKTGFYLRNLFPVVIIAFVQRMDKGSGSCRYYNHDWFYYRNTCCSPYLTLLSWHSDPEKKPYCYCTFMAGHQQYYIFNLFIALYNKY